MCRSYAVVGRALLAVPGRIILPGHRQDGLFPSLYSTADHDLSTSNKGAFPRPPDWGNEGCRAKWGVLGTWTTFDMDGVVPHGDCLPQGLRCARCVPPGPTPKPLVPLVRVDCDLNIP